MTDIVFTHSYVLALDPKEHRAMMPYPPLGTLYAAAVAREHGYSVALFDSMLAASDADIEPVLALHRPRYVVIYDDDFNYLTKMCLTRMRGIAFELARRARAHGCTVIVHSSDATDHVELYLDHGVDYVLVGEAERTLAELLTLLDAGSERPPWEVAGVVCRDGGGKMRRAPARAVLRELDSLPLPARDLVETDRYRELWRTHHGYFSVNMVTTRGCPFHCNWCAKPLYGQVYNSHSPERVAHEMLQIKRTWAPEHIWFCDDIFGLKPGWLEEFSMWVQQLDATIPFKCLSRADLLLRGGTVDWLRKAGCQTVWIGAESGSQAVLDAMDKGITVEQILEATARLRSAGIRIGFFLQFGYPGEGAPEIAQTIEMVRRARPDEIGISVSYPLPGTKFHEQVRQHMGRKHNWTQSSDLAMLYQGAFSTDYYRRLAQWVHMDHRRMQAADALRALARLSDMPSRQDLRRIALAPYYLLNRELHGVRLKPSPI